MAWRDWRDRCEMSVTGEIERDGEGDTLSRKNGSLFIGLLGKTLVQTCNVAHGGRTKLLEEHFSSATDR